MGILAEYNMPDSLHHGYPTGVQHAGAVTMKLTLLINIWSCFMLSYHWESMLINFVTPKTLIMQIGRVHLQKVLYHEMKLYVSDKKDGLYDVIIGEKSSHSYLVFIKDLILCNRPTNY